MTKKYKLFSTQGEEKAPCAFFMSDKGCRNGDNCKFAHIEASGATIHGDTRKAARTVVETGSVVSSESEDDEEIAVIEKSEEHEESGKKRKKNRRGSTSDSPFAKPKKVKPTPPTTVDTKNTPTPEKNSNKKAAKPKQENPSFRSLKLPVASLPPSSVDETNEDEVSEDEVIDAKPSGFRGLDLPIASFSLGSASENARNPTKNSKPEPPTVNKTPLPKRTKTGRKWLDAVVKTREDPKYESEFDYSKYKAADEPLGGEKIWVRTKPFGDWCKNNPQAIAMDCEMCETTDPKSGKKDYRALCRISVVDAETDDVLLDSLVKPEWPVTDYRSHINGITKEHLEGVEFTLRHAQEFMLALCSEETIVMGHSVNNDLAAIRMEHYCVVDSACLFKAADCDTATVGLKDLSMHVMKKPMPNVHDSVNDSRVALRCLEHYLEKRGDVERVVRTPRTPKKNSANQLFIHRIPGNVKKEHLSDVFLEHTSVAVEEVDDIVFNPDKQGKTHVHFKTRAHANLAFVTLEGAAETDASGRLQKKIYLRGGNYIRVRKMMREPERKKEATSP